MTINPLALSKITKNGVKAVMSMGKRVIYQPDVVSVKQFPKCSETLGRAQVFKYRGEIKLPERKEEVMAIVKEIVNEKGMHVKKLGSHERHFKAGRAVEGINDLYYNDIVGKCKRNKHGFLEKIYTVDTKTREVTIYNKDKSIFRQFTPEEMSAMYEYKYHPAEIHGILRNYGRYYGVEPTEITQKSIEMLNELFRNPNKHYSLKKPKVVYRALQSRLSDAQNMALLKGEGEIFVEPSFVSTTKKYETARRFWHKSPIMEITLPKNTKYLNLDEVFNIDSQHWTEEELLLPRNSRFLITGRDWSKNVIKAQYIPE